jgi:hypothetical protein
MKITTKEIIKILPFEEKFKTGLLEGFDSLNADQKYHIERVVWNFYEALYNLKLQENLETAMIDVKKGGIDVDEEFYGKIKKQTEEEMTKNFYKGTADADLSKIRSKLEEILAMTK